MTLIFETPHYAARRDYMGHWELRHKDSGASVYLQGDDARVFARDIERIPAHILDLAISEYQEVMS